MIGDFRICLEIACFQHKYIFLHSNPLRFWVKQIESCSCNQSARACSQKLPKRKRERWDWTEKIWPSVQLPHRPCPLFRKLWSWDDLLNCPSWAKEVRPCFITQSLILLPSLKEGSLLKPRANPRDGLYCELSRSEIPYSWGWKHCPEEGIWMMLHTDQ